VSVSNRIHTFFVVKEPGAPERVLVWDTQDLTVGRASGNDLRVELADVSRRHARFARVEGGCVVANLSSSNATCVNGREVRTQTLKSRDVVRIGDLELHFFQAAKNPAALGRPVQYASQLKSFGLPGGGGDAGATVLGLVQEAEGDDDFPVAPASEFEYDLQAMDERRSVPRNLDPELEEPKLSDVTAPGKVWRLEEADAEAPGRLSLRVTVDGLTPDLRRALVALAGKGIELPALRIRLDPDDDLST